MIRASGTLSTVDETKEALLDAIIGIIEQRSWNQQQTAAILRTTQSRVSELQRRKTRQFSLDKLIDYAAMLGITVLYEVHTL